MIAVSLGDCDCSKVINRSENSGSECSSPVHKAEVSVPNERNLVIVKEAKKGDGKGHDQSYPECSLMGENHRSNTEQRGTVDGKRGMIRKREQNGRFILGDHQMMHSATGITHLSRLCSL